MDYSPEQIQQVFQAITHTRDTDVRGYGHHLVALISAIHTFQSEELKHQLLGELVWTFAHAPHRLGEAAMTRILENKMMPFEQRIKVAEFLYARSDEKSFTQTPAGRSFRVFVKSWLDQAKATGFMHTGMDRVSPRPCDDWVNPAHALCNAQRSRVEQIEDVEVDEVEPESSFTPPQKKVNKPSAEDCFDKFLARLAAIEEKINADKPAPPTFSFGAPAPDLEGPAKKATGKRKPAAKSSRTTRAKKADKPESPPDSE
jgi:hypothetical protein